jgi:hypothetical protein
MLGASPPATFKRIATGTAPENEQDTSEPFKEEAPFRLPGPLASRPRRIGQ